MTVTRRVAASVWLAVCEAPPGVRLRGLGRRVADRAAASMAWATALQATGLSAENVAGSRAHTEGAGAALVGPCGTVLGVDLVPEQRITPRHASAILDREEWEDLPGPLSLRPALGWGLKEAAAKALGTPVRRFPAGLRIRCTANGVEVTDSNDPYSRLLGHWLELGSLVCVWVLRPR